MKGCCAATAWRRECEKNGRPDLTRMSQRDDDIISAQEGREGSETCSWRMNLMVWLLVPVSSWRINQLRSGKPMFSLNILLNLPQKFSSGHKLLWQELYLCEIIFQWFLKFWLWPHPELQNRFLSGEQTFVYGLVPLSQRRISAFFMIGAAGRKKKNTQGCFSWGCSSGVPGTSARQSKKITRTE